jgi:hypothetical protein
VTARTVLVAALALLVLAPGLLACGKRSPLKPPAGQESGYSYPRAYPTPASVLPSGASAVEADDEAGAEDKAGEGRKLSPIPPSSSRTKTSTYGPLSE